MQLLHGIEPDSMPRQVIKPNTDVIDFSFSSADANAILKNHIRLSQKMGNSCE